MGRSAGRNCRKKLAKHAQFASVAGQPREKRVSEGIDIDLLERAEQVKEQLRSVQEQFLNQYTLDLRKRSTVLGAGGCWEYLIEKLPQARRLGIEDRLRWLVIEHAARFSGQPPGRSTPSLTGNRVQ